MEDFGFTGEALTALSVLALVMPVFLERAIELLRSRFGWDSVDGEAMARNVGAGAFFAFVLIGWGAAPEFVFPALPESYVLVDWLAWGSRLFVAASGVLMYFVRGSMRTHDMIKSLKKES